VGWGGRIEEDARAKLRSGRMVEEICIC